MPAFKKFASLHKNLILHLTTA